MDTLFAHAVGKISEMPLEVQRFVGEALLDGAAQPNLPVIEFTDEENAMIDEALAEVEAGNTISQAEMKAYFQELREQAYARP